MSKTVKFILVGFLTLSLSGCFWMSVKTYINKTKPDFEEVKKDTENYGNELSNKDISYEKKLADTQALQEKVANNQQNLAKINPPAKAKSLQENLKKYYAGIEEIVDQLINLVEFFSITEDVADNLKKSSDYLPKDFSADLASAKNKFAELKDRQKKQLEELKNKQVSSDFSKSKYILEGILGAYVDFLDSIMLALDKKDSKLMKEDEFQHKLNTLGNDFSSAMDNLKNTIFDQKKIDELDNLEDEINKQFSEIK